MKKKRQINRRIITLSLFLLMPMIMKLFSPIMTIKTALVGVLSASIITIILMFLAGMFTGRLWCGWLCPAGGIQDVVSGFISTKKANDKFRLIKYFSTILQISFIIICFLIINEDLTLDYFYGISFDYGIMDWVFYYIMIVLFFGLPFLFGKRSYCNHFCMIAPIMILGKKFGDLLGIKRKHIFAQSEKCIDCKICNKNCIADLDVSSQAKLGKITHNDCISCLMCVDTCPKNVLFFAKDKQKEEL